MIFARKMPEFSTKIALKFFPIFFFWGGGARAPFPPSPTPMVSRSHHISRQAKIAIFRFHGYSVQMGISYPHLERGFGPHNGRPVRWAFPRILVL